MLGWTLSGPARRATCTLAGGRAPCRTCPMSDPRGDTGDDGVMEVVTAGAQASELTGGAMAPSAAGATSGGGSAATGADAGAGTAAPTLARQKELAATLARVLHAPSVEAAEVAEAEQALPWLHEFSDKEFPRGLLAPKARALKRLGDVISVGEEDTAVAISEALAEAGALGDLVTLCRGEDDEEAPLANPRAWSRVRTQAAAILSCVANVRSSASAALVDAGAAEAFAALLADCDPIALAVGPHAGEAFRGAAAGGIAALCVSAARADVIAAGGDPDSASALPSTAAETAAAAAAADAAGADATAKATAAAASTRDATKERPGSTVGRRFLELGVARLLLGAVEEDVMDAAMGGILREQTTGKDGTAVTARVTTGESCLDALCRIAVACPVEARDLLEAEGGLAGILVWTIGAPLVRNGTVSDTIQVQARRLLALLYNPDSPDGAQGIPPVAIRRLVATVGDTSFDIGKRSYACKAVYTVVRTMAERVGGEIVRSLLTTCFRAGMVPNLMALLESNVGGSGSGSGGKAATPVSPSLARDAFWVLGLMFMFEGAAAQAPGAAAMLTDVIKRGTKAARNRKKVASSGGGGGGDKARRGKGGGGGGRRGGGPAKSGVAAAAAAAAAAGVGSREEATAAAKAVVAEARAASGAAEGPGGRADDGTGTSRGASAGAGAGAAAAAGLDSGSDAASGAGAATGESDAGAMSVHASDAAVGAAAGALSALLRGDDEATDTAVKLGIVEPVLEQLQRREVQHDTSDFVAHISLLRTVLEHSPTVAGPIAVAYGAAAVLPTLKRLPLEEKVLAAVDQCLTVLKGATDAAQKEADSAQEALLKMIAEGAPGLDAALAGGGRPATLSNRARNKRAAKAAGKQARQHARAAKKAAGPAASEGAGAGAGGGASSASPEEVEPVLPTDETDLLAAITAVLTEVAPGAVGTQDIVKALAGDAAAETQSMVDAVAAALRTLKERGDVTRNKKGRWRLAGADAESGGVAKDGSSGQDDKGNAGGT